jgi:NADH:ubiquinone oxidoreductase subunit E
MESEVEIILRDYSKEDLAQMLLFCLDIIQEKNKLLKDKIVKE